MTVKQLERLFRKHEEEYLEFERVTNHRSARPDIHAFLLLNELCPGDGDIVDAAEHDQIYLGVQPEDLAAVVTEEQVIELRRCGVCCYESSGLTMNC